jgi:hypothetical protein
MDKELEDLCDLASRDFFFRCDEAQRQMIILALAKLSIERPGFLPCLEEIAVLLGDSIDGKAEMFHGFRRMQA